MEDKRDLMKKIRDEVVELTASPLYRERVRNGVFPVIGEGSHDTAVMFIGEAPGKNEAKTGRPFCGAAGKVLDELLASAGIERSSVYITNIVKDRPPNNRDPSPVEIAMYAPFLDRQIEIIRPKVLATLGRFSMEYVMRAMGLEDRIQPISKIHGQVFEGKASHGGPVQVVPLFHPAVAVYNSHTKDMLKQDIAVLQPFLS